jgi:DNA-binding transcriptional ArsR family regulator
MKYQPNRCGPDPGRAMLGGVTMTSESTTELSLKLGQSPSSVSQHLSVLRRSGLVTSWRSGRRVLYRRTDLATSIVEANSVAPAAGWHTPA